MIKKIGTLLLALILCVTAFVVPVSADFPNDYTLADGAQIAFKVELDKEYYKGGDTVTVSIYALADDALEYGAGAISIGVNTAIFTAADNTAATIKASATSNDAYNTYFKEANQSSWSYLTATTNTNYKKIYNNNTADENAMYNAYVKLVIARNMSGSHENAGSQTNGIYGSDINGNSDPLVTFQLKVAEGVADQTKINVGIPSGSYTGGAAQTYLNVFADPGNATTATKTDNTTTDTTFAKVQATAGVEPCAPEDHVWDAGVVTTDPTCGEAGVRTLTCTVCSSTSEVEEPATGNHTASEKVAIENEVPASCKDNGSHDEVVYCSECGAEMSRENKVDLATGEHVYAEVVDSKEATCKEDGYEVKKCACGETQTTTFSKDEVAHTGGTATCMAAAVCDVCGNAYGELDAANHTGNNTTVNAKEATCAVDGYTGDTVCECGVTVATGTVIPATGAHVGGTATCMAAAVCDVCGNAYGDKDVANHTGNNTVVGKKEATCGADGYTGDTVCECGETVEKGEVDPATGKHTYESSVTKNPTCSRKGTMKYTCSECGHSYTEDIPALNHVRDGVSGLKEIPAVEATCKEPGKTAGEVCEYCNTQTIVPQTVPTKEHSWDNGVVTEPTYTSEGYTTFTCTACGETKVDNYVPKLEMNVSVAIRQPSITKIRCKDTIVLHTVVEGVEDYTVVWTADNENFVMTDLEDGKLEITSAEDGFTVFTATVYDAEGNAVGSDTVEMQSKADIWGKIGGFFRALFGSTLYYNY